MPLGILSLEPRASFLGLSFTRERLLPPPRSTSRGVGAPLNAPTQAKTKPPLLWFSSVCNGRPAVLKRTSGTTQEEITDPMNKLGIVGFPKHSLWLESHQVPGEAEPEGQGRRWVARGHQLNSKDEEVQAFTISSAEAAKWPPVQNQRDQSQRPSGPRPVLRSQLQTQNFRGQQGWRQHKAGQAPGNQNLYPSQTGPQGCWLAVRLSGLSESKEFRVERKASFLF